MTTGAWYQATSCGAAHPVTAPKAIYATVIGLYYLAYFAANTMVDWVGGF